MTIKFLGAILIFIGCAGYGFFLAANQIREAKTLENLSRILDFMLWELQYKLTPLPNLCRSAASEAKGTLQTIFNELAAELDRQVCPDAKKCMSAVLAKHPSLPPISASCLREFGASLGRFDLNGQLEAINSVSQCCRVSLENLRDGQDVRLRTYRTLGICCGAALVIIFI